MEFIVNIISKELDNNLNKINKYENEIKLLQDNISKLKNTNETLLNMIKIHDINTNQTIAINQTQTIAIDQTNTINVIQEKNNYIDKYYVLLKEIYELYNYTIEDHKHYKFIRLSNACNKEVGLIIYDMSNDDKFEINNECNFVYGKVKKSQLYYTNGNTYDDRTYDKYNVCYKLAVSVYGMYKNENPYQKAPVFLYEESEKICLLKFNHNKNLKDNITILREYKTDDKSNINNQLVIQLIDDIYIDTEMIINLENQKKLSCDKSWGKWNHNGIEFNNINNNIDLGNVVALSRHGAITPCIFKQSCDKIKYLIKKINKTLLIINTEEMKSETYQLNQDEEIIIDKIGMYYSQKPLIIFEKKQ